MAAINGYASDLAERVQDNLFINGTTPYQGTLYCALTEGTNPGDGLPDVQTGGGAECQGSGYARIAVDCSGVDFGSSSTTTGDTETLNIQPLTFPIATANWALNVCGFVLCKTNGAGTTFTDTDIVVGGPLQSAKTITQDTIPVFQAGGMEIHTLNQ